MKKGLLEMVNSMKNLINLMRSEKKTKLVSNGSAYVPHRAQPIHICLQGIE